MNTTPSRPPGRFLLLAGLLVAFGAPLVHLARSLAGAFDSGLWLPWAMGGGVLLLALAFGLRRSVGRGIGLGLAGLALALTVWVIAAMGLEPYAGPARIGGSLPDFSARRADGASFGPGDLADGQRRILVFYRGWW